MKKVPIILFIFFSSFIALKGQSIPIQNKGVTRALVIGISDYQDERITDLRFADKDANAFAEYLVSESGYGINKDNILVLINEKATSAQFDAGLSWLVDESQDGDEVIIYFSGHGDMETKTRRQLGYLLCWDTPPQSYIMGSMPIYYFNAYIETLMLDNKAKVIIITDACRAGKLAGDEINGSQLANANLAKIYDNEIKILSCQPNELSVEGEQWGGGRGAFSYHLIEGLYGLADQNADYQVTLSELDRYLEEKITTEVAPDQQMPLVQGNRREVLGKVHEEMLVKLKQSKETQTYAFTSIETKGIDTKLFEKLDEKTRQKLVDYNSALDRNYFFEWSEVNKGELSACADDLFDELMYNIELEPMANHLKRNYAAALQDDAQQFYNSVLKGDLTTISTNNRLSDSKRLKTFPLQLERAAEILGPDHYIYNQLKAKQEYFKAISAWLEKPLIDDASNGDVILKHLQKSVEWEPENAQAYSFLGNLYASKLNNPDSALFYADKAVELSPSWVVPYVGIADVYTTKKEFDLAMVLIEKAAAIDSNSVIVLNTKSKIQIQLNQYDEAENQLKKAIEIEPGWSVLYKNLSFLYFTRGNMKEAEIMAQKAIECNAEEIRAIQILAWTYIYSDRMEQAGELLYRALSLDKANAFELNYDLSCYYSLNDKLDIAFKYLADALEKGYKDYNRMHTDSDLAKLRLETCRWKALIQKYFPDKKGM